MACAACQRQRMAVKDNLKSGNVVGAVRAAAQGVGMMTGMLPKGAAPTSHLTPGVTQPSRKIATSNAQRSVRNAALRGDK